jgi:general nucleoside transport system permease protein
MMERLRKPFTWDLTTMVPPVLAVVVSLLMGGVVILFVGENPFTAYGAMLMGAVGDADAITSTLARQIPFLLTGLSYAVAFQAGLINLGTEGQLYLGALVAGMVGYMINLPAILMIPTVLLAGALAGGMWGWVAGWLRAKFGISEFLTTLMMNYIATLFTSWAVNYPFKDRTPESKGMIAQTQKMVDSARLGDLWPGTRLHWGYVIAMLLVVALWYFLMRTRRGYEFRMHGANPLFAEYGGVDKGAVVRQALFMAGGLSGIAGAIEVMGVHYKFVDLFSPGYGFDGISAAILGNSTPLGTWVASLLFSALRTGAMGMDRNTAVPFELRNVVQATVIFFIASNLFINYGKYFRRRRKAAAAKEEKGVELV